MIFITASLFSKSTFRRCGSVGRIFQRYAPCSWNSAPANWGGPHRAYTEAGLILLGQPYPGNVRELEALVERVVNLAPEDRDELGPEYLITEGDRLPRCISLAEFRQMQEKWYMQQAGKLYRGDLRACAEALGVHPRTLRRRLGKQGVAPDRVSAFPD